MNQTKCSGCGGYMTFSPKDQNLKCIYCEKTESLADIKPAKNITKEYSSDYKIQTREDESRHYECTSCGNIIILDDEARKRCPSCGDKALSPKRVGVNIPDALVPFKITSEEAKIHFKEWIKKRKFAPNNLKKLAKLGKLSGMYTPSWSYDMTLIGSYSGKVSWEVEVSKDETETRSKSVHGSINEYFEDVLVTGNNQVDSSILQNTAPYNIGGAYAYDSRLLLGFSGLDTNINPHSAHEEALEQSKKAIERKLRNELSRGKYSVDYLNISVSPINEKIKYLFLPLYASHYTYKNKKYHTYINGQTGTTTGKYPKSIWKIMALILGILAVVGAIGYLVSKNI